MVDLTTGEVLNPDGTPINKEDETLEDVNPEVEQIEVTETPEDGAEEDVASVPTTQDAFTIEEGTHEEAASGDTLEGVT